MCQNLSSLDLRIALRSEFGYEVDSDCKQISDQMYQSHSHQFLTSEMLVELSESLEEFARLNVMTLILLYIENKCFEIFRHFYFIAICHQIGIFLHSRR